ncbi:MAG: type 4a pilus biogenesis protein PilO [Desulfomicrobium escambiense]|nr:type 4a pilus biogenesis protein PilO [Desulfomicrobium escambiense]
MSSTQKTDAGRPVPGVLPAGRAREEAGARFPSRPSRPRRRREERGEVMKNWPWYGYLVFAVLIFALAFLFYFKPQNAKLKALTAERVKVEAEVQNLKQKKRELDKIEADIVAMTAKLKTLEVNIPQRKEIADILRQIQALAYDSRLDVLRFAPGKEINKELLRRVADPHPGLRELPQPRHVLRQAEQVRPGLHHRELHHQDLEPPDGPEHGLRQLDGQDLLLRRADGRRRAGQKTSEAKTMRKAAVLLTVVLLAGLAPLLAQETAAAPPPETAPAGTHRPDGLHLQPRGPPGPLQEPPGRPRPQGEGGDRRKPDVHRRPRPLRHRQEQERLHRHDRHSPRDSRCSPRSATSSRTGTSCPSPRRRSSCGRPTTGGSRSSDRETSSRKSRRSCNMNKRILPAVLAGLCALALVALHAQGPAPAVHIGKIQVQAGTLSTRLVMETDGPLAVEKAYYLGRFPPDARPRHRPGLDGRRAGPPLLRIGARPRRPGRKGRRRRAPSPRPSERTGPGPDRPRVRPDRRRAQRHPEGPDRLRRRRLDPGRARPHAQERHPPEQGRHVRRRGQRLRQGRPERRRRHPGLRPGEPAASRRRPLRHAPRRQVGRLADRRSAVDGPEGPRGPVPGGRPAAHHPDGLRPQGSPGSTPWTPARDGLGRVLLPLRDDRTGRRGRPRRPSSSRRLRPAAGPGAGPEEGRSPRSGPTPGRAQGRDDRGPLPDPRGPRLPPRRSRPSRPKPSRRSSSPRRSSGTKRSTPATSSASRSRTPTSRTSSSTWPSSPG